jgi:hypothetical protein
MHCPLCWCRFVISRVAIVKNDYVVIIWLKNSKEAKFITAYVADNSIEKIRKSPKWERL